MNGPLKKPINRRYIAIALIIVGAILLGFVVDLVWGMIEKKTSPQKYSDYVRHYAYEYNVPESLIFAVIKVESNFDPDAFSDAGAMGLMQMMPSTFAEMTTYNYLNEYLIDGDTYLALTRKQKEEGLSGSEKALLGSMKKEILGLLQDPEVSIRYGTYYLKYLHGYFGGNWDNAIAAYNGGMGNVSKWLENSEYSDGKGNLTYIPFEETKNYVQKVKKARVTYQKLYYEDGKEVNIYE